MKKFYITTAIDYPSSKPHCGHLYEKICADVIARFKRLQGFDVYFSTGLDEHGLKIQRAAKKSGKKPKEFVDEMAKFFLELCKKYSISYDDFIRTTEKRHEKVVYRIFKRLWDSEDIYSGFYKGQYCVDCETFYTEKDLKNGKCPVHDKPTETVEELSYFFKMSRYQNDLIDYIKKNPDFIKPTSRRNEILNRLKEPLKDLSVSRKNVKWGIPLPFDKGYTVAVWGDALINYISVIGGLDSLKFKKFWPADIHLIGPDIIWHHCVIFPTMLMSAKIKLPKNIVVHGFITINGEKMSKARGIAIDPLELVKKYPADAIRYFLIRQIPLGEDGDFSEEALKNRINGELLGDLGNLVSRTLTLVEKSNVKLEGKKELEKKLNLKKIEDYMEKLELNNALTEIWSLIRYANKYVNDKEPWNLKGKELGNVLYNLVEALRIIAILLYAFIPETAEKINKQLGVKTGSFKDCKFGKFKGKIKKGKHLFEKVK